MKKLLGALLFLIAICSVQAATLVWDPNLESDIAGYKVYFRVGTSNAAYLPPIDVGNKTNYVLTNLVFGTQYFLNVSAYNTAGVESELSDTLPFKPAQGIPPGPAILSAGAVKTNGQWMISASWSAAADQWAVDGYWVTVKQDGITLTNKFTTALNFSGLFPTRSPTVLYIQSTNYYGLSSQTPVLSINQPARPRKPVLVLP